MASWIKDAFDSARGAVLTAWQQATQAAQVAAVQASQAAQVAASQAASAAEQAAPLAQKALPIVSNAVLPGSGLGSLGISAFNKTNTNTTQTLTDSSVRVRYADNRIAASEGSIVAAGGTVSLAGIDPQAYASGGLLGSGSAPIATGDVGSGSIASATAAEMNLSNRIWIYMALGVVALAAAFFLIRRRSRK